MRCLREILGAAPLSVTRGHERAKVYINHQCITVTGHNNYIETLKCIDITFRNYYYQLEIQNPFPYIKDNRIKKNI